MTPHIMTKAELSCTIDLVCDAINVVKSKGKDSGDIQLICSNQVEKIICELFTSGEEVLTCEAVFGNVKMLCWGETKDKHKAWVNSH